MVRANSPNDPGRHCDSVGQSILAAPLPVTTPLSRKAAAPARQSVRPSGARPFSRPRTDDSVLGSRLGRRHPAADGWAGRKSVH